MKKLILIFTMILVTGVSLAFAGDYREVIFGNSYTNINEVYDDELLTACKNNGVSKSYGYKDFHLYEEKYGNETVYRFVASVNPLTYENAVKGYMEGTRKVFQLVFIRKNGRIYELSGDDIIGYASGDGTVRSWDEKRTLAEELEEYFSSEVIYEGKFLRGGLGTNFAEYTDPQGKTYRLGIGSKASFLKLLYPLNMDKPVPILQADSFLVVRGDGYYLTNLSPLEAKSDGRAYLHENFGYGYKSADAGCVSLAYHYFDDDGFYVYQYQTDEMGNIEENQRYQYVQYGNPYEFHSISNSLESGEPTGKSRFGCFTKGSYWNPICRLKLRSSAGGEVIGTIEGGTLLEALEEGKRATIDGYTSAWVKVRAVNRERFVEGGDFTQTGWVFGAYLD